MKWCYGLMLAQTKIIPALRTIISHGNFFCYLFQNMRSINRIIDDCFATATSNSAANEETAAGTLVWLKDGVQELATPPYLNNTPDFGQLIG